MKKIEKKIEKMEKNEKTNEIDEKTMQYLFSEPFCIPSLTHVHHGRILSCLVGDCGGQSRWVRSWVVSKGVIVVLVGPKFPFRQVLSFPFRSSVLEPDFYLCLCEFQGFR